MQLTHITIRGTMIATAWGSMLGDDTAGMQCEFSADYAAPKAPHSPWQRDWQDLRTALMEASESGDMIGGRGDIIDAAITFHMAERGKRLEVTRYLSPTPNTSDLWAAIPA